jgi:hypothetical protein
MTGLWFAAEAEIVRDAILLAIVMKTTKIAGAKLAFLI